MKAFGFSLLLLGSFTAACGAASLPEPTALDATRVSQRFPGATLAELQHGRELYVGRCADCHQLFEPSRFTPEKWRTELGDMRGRARLSTEEEQLILQYLVSVRLRVPDSGEGS